MSAAIPVTTVVVAIGVQLAAFAPDYFGSHTNRYADLFEDPSQYRATEQLIDSNHVRNLPLVTHSGYLRDKVLEYFSDDRLSVDLWTSSCSPLPVDRLAGLAPRSVLVIGETTAYDGTFCFTSSTQVIEADESLLRANGWKVRSLGRIFNSPQHVQQTEVLVVERP